MLKSLKKMTLFMALMSLCFSAQAQIDFQRLSLDEALAKSKQTGKHIFIDFRADWCKPCVAMELETFSNTQVGNAINSKYIPIKADVDFFEWMDVKENYNVAVLPTILIINSEGAVQHRLIGQKDPSGLMSELGLRYNENDNIKITKEDPAEEIPHESKKECALVRWWRKISR